MRQIAFALLIAATPFAASAQSVQSDAQFQIERQGDSIVRLDKKTGAISTCTMEGQTLDCRSSTDERAAMQAEIDRLANEVDQLKQQIASADGAAKTGVDKSGKELTIKLPSEEEIKGVMTYLEDIWRKFVDQVRDLTNDKA